MRRKRCKQKKVRRVPVSRQQWLQDLVAISQRQAAEQPKGSYLHDLFTHQAQRLEAEIKEQELLDKLPSPTSSAMSQ